MSSESELLQAGIDAIKQGRYSEAVNILADFCATCADCQSKEYFQAQMWLVKAYQQNGQLQKAMALCQEMTASEIPQVQTWALRVLPTLSAAQTAASSQTLSADLVELFQAGQKALKEKRYPEAIESLQAFCQACNDPNSDDYIQALMGLVKAYQRTHDFDAAISICEQLANQNDPLIHQWLQQIQPSLLAAKAKKESQTEEKQLAPDNEEESEAQNPKKSFGKAGRVAQVGIKLTMKGIAANLAMASTVTLGLLFGMLFILFITIVFNLKLNNPGLGLGMALIFTVVFNTIMFFLSPLLMDLVQSWLYQTRWVTLSEVQRYSPETAEMIQRVCKQKNLQQPRLGIINDQNPTAFTYGSLPNSARLVVSQGIFTYLDDDEIATVYAHELGHIVHWDFAVMTLASTLVQITYLIYDYANEFRHRIDNKQVKAAIQNAALMAYIFYIIGTYLLLYLSRTREYYADHFAAEMTGNPNALSRALIKIAYGIMEEGERVKEPSKLIQGTRALGIYDPKAAMNTGTAYRIASEPAAVGRLFLWDMFNPWGWWMELKSTHPLTGKRVRALSNYAEQLGLETEFDIALVIREGKKLNKKKLYGNFILDQFLYVLDLIGVGLGFLIAIGLFSLELHLKRYHFSVFVSLPLLGFGFGTLIKMVVMFPDFKRMSESNIITLMSNPYSSPLRGQGVKLSGKIIGRGDSGYKFGSDMKFQDETGMIYIRYASRFGPIGNFLFGMGLLTGLIGSNVTLTGWFRRGIAPWVDVMDMETDRAGLVKSYPRFWTLIVGVLCIIGGFLLH